MYKGKVLVSNDMQPVSLGVSTILQEFDDVFPEEVPTGLPPLHGIELQINLTSHQPVHPHGLTFFCFTLLDRICKQLLLH
jgi:hypothetical protein